MPGMWDPATGFLLKAVFEDSFNEKLAAFRRNGMEPGNLKNIQNQAICITTCL